MLDGARNRFQDRRRPFHHACVAAQIINGLSFFRRQRTAGERRFQKERAGVAHHFIELDCPLRGDRAGLDDQLAGPEFRQNLLQNRLYRGRIGNQNEYGFRSCNSLLNRRGEVGKFLGRAIPTTHVVTVGDQVLGPGATDNSQS